MSKPCQYCGGTGLRFTTNIDKYMAGKDVLDATQRLSRAYYGIRDDDAKKELIMKAMHAAEAVVDAYLSEASQYPKEEQA